MRCARRVTHYEETRLAFCCQLTLTLGQKCFRGEQCGWKAHLVSRCGRKMSLPFLSPLSVSARSPPCRHCVSYLQICDSLLCCVRKIAPKNFQVFPWNETIQSHLCLKPTCLSVMSVPTPPRPLLLSLRAAEVSPRGWVDFRTGRGQPWASGDMRPYPAAQWRPVRRTDGWRWPHWTHRFSLSLTSQSLQTSFSNTVKKKKCIRWESVSDTLVVGPELWTRYVGDRKPLDDRPFFCF